MVSRLDELDREHKEWLAICEKYTTKNCPYLLEVLKDIVKDKWSRWQSEIYKYKYGEKK